MKRFSFLCGVVVCALSCSPAQESPIGEFLASEPQVLSYWSDVDPTVAQILLAKFDDHRIANHGECFQETDFVTGDLPWRKFIVGARERDKWLVAYSHGGVARHDHVVLFSTATDPPAVVYSAIGNLPADTLWLVEQASKLGALEREEYDEW